jgi:hypothetical protein
MSSSRRIVVNRIMVFVTSVLVVGVASGAVVGLQATADNAALLYYQAFLQCTKPDVTTQLAMNRVLGGAEPNQVVRLYLGGQDCHEAIELALEATRVTQCVWAVDYARHRPSLVTIVGQVRDLATLIAVDAAILVADGNACDALNHALSLRQVASHIGNEGNDGYLASLATQRVALSCVQHVLSTLPLDSGTYKWLSGQLSGVQGGPVSPLKATEISLANAMAYLRMEPVVILAWRGDVTRMVKDEGVRQGLLDLTDQEVLQQAGDFYETYLASVNWVIGGGLPYEQKYAKLLALQGDLLNQVYSCQPVRILKLYVPLDLVAEYDLYVTRVADFNALLTAIEIYLVRAETGQLPQTLPPGMPNDPFSGEGFEYDTTDQGFVLRCRAEDIGEHRIYEYDFSIAR